MTQAFMGAFYFPNPELLKVPQEINRDKYGFQLPYPFVDSEQLVRFSNGYIDKVEYRESQWKRLLEESGNIPPERSEKVKRYIRKGIPGSLRGKMWFYYSGAEAKWSINRNVYSGLISQLTARKMQTEFSGEINQDLHRTFPNNIHFKTELDSTDNQSFDVNKRPILSALRRVLLCFSIFRPDIGYSQAFSYIVGVLLLFMDEQKAFWTLTVIVEDLMPQKLYLRGMEGATMEVRVLLSLVKSRLPNLWQHFNNCERLGMPPPDLALTHWFPLLFADILPIESTLRVWDSFFYEGPKVIFRTALALFNLFENELLATKDPLKLFQCIQNIPKKAFNCHHLMETAFSRPCGLARSDLNYQRGLAAQRLE